MAEFGPLGDLERHCIGLKCRVSPTTCRLIALGSQSRLQKKRIFVWFLFCAKTSKLGLEIFTVPDTSFGLPCEVTLTPNTSKTILPIYSNVQDFVHRLILRLDL